MSLGDCEKPGKTVGACERTVRGRERGWVPVSGLYDAEETARGME